jgi:hypothetical protein
MKIALGIVGGLVTLMGIVWFLQGVNILPGSQLMSGQPQWALYGGIAVIIGIALLVVAFRRKALPPR